MKRGRALSSLLCLMAGVAIIYTVRVADRLGLPRLDLGGRTCAASLDPRTLEALARAEPIHVDYFVSRRERMPAAMKGLEAEVRALLAALARAAPGFFAYRVIDPDLGGAPAVSVAARAGAAPVAVPSIHGDEAGGRSVWSSLVLASGARRPVALPLGDRAATDSLQRLIAGLLESFERPIRPTFAVAGTASSSSLRAALAGFGAVRTFDPYSEPRIPEDVDVLFWLDPGPIGPGLVKEFERFIASGRAAVLAGNEYSVDGVAGSGGMRSLLAPLGLEPAEDLLLDSSAAAPFDLEVSPERTDFDRFLVPPEGRLLFPAAGPLRVDPVRTARAGYDAQVCASSSERSLVMSPPPGALRPADRAGAAPVGNQPVMVALWPRDPRRGEVLVLSGASPLADGAYGRPGFANQALLTSIARTLARPERLVLARAAAEGARFARPSAAARLSWRLFSAVLLPGALLAAATALSRGRPGRLVLPSPDPRVLGLGLAALACLLVGARLTRLPGLPRWDLTQGGLESPSPLARRRLAAWDGRLRAELIISSRSEMPATMKGLEAAVLSRLSGLGLAAAVRRPESLSEARRALLADLGVAPVPTETVEHDETVRRWVWSALLLSDGKATEAVPELRPEGLSHLDFLVLAAAERLRTGGSVRVAVHSDLPRLSPAEAFMLFQSKRKAAPQGTDPFAAMKALLRRYGYQVAYINPTDPRLPERTDVLIWVQPRLRADRMRELLSRHLARGGKALVAVQHFKIRQRRYRGRGFDAVYWPQPQYQDIEPYLNLLGIRQVREVLMDRTRSSLRADYEVYRGAESREREAQQVGEPFLVRAVEAGFSTASVVTAALSDQLFIWGNRFEVDASSLARAGLRAETIIATSERSWRYLWKGGWIPPAAFDAPAFLPGRQSLALRVTGRFPPAEALPESSGKVRPMRLLPAPPDAADGELILIGCSEMFSDARLFEPGFRHDQLLLNAVAALGHDAGLAALQAREPRIRGFAHVEPAARLGWRAFVVAAGPLAFLLLVLARTRRGPEAPG